MLALVKKPRIELSIQGEGVDDLIDWIKKKYEIKILSFEDNNDNEDNIDIEKTEFWKNMQSNRLGNILAGSRIKANLTQKQLAEKLNITTKMVSDYERGRRTLSQDIAQHIAKILNINIERLT